MNKVAFTSVLSYQPYSNRSEHLNYGVVVFMPEGGVRVFIEGNLRKIQAFYPKANISNLQNKIKTIPDLVQDKDLDSALGILNAWRELRDVQKKDLGCFLYSNENEFKKWVSILLKDTCAIAITEKKPFDRIYRSRLYSEVLKDFKNIGIYDFDKTGNPDHRVVTNYTPDESLDIVVEFALQNGMLHVAQTIDLRNPDTPQKDRAFSKLYKIGYIKEHFNSSSIKSYVIVAGSANATAQRVIKTIQNDADMIIDWEDRKSINQFYESWAGYAGKTLPEIPVIN